MSPETEPLYAKIKTLNEFLWESRTPRTAVNEWLNNFRGSIASKPVEQVNALYLLSKFLYFGDREVRALLRAMFQDLIRNPLTVKARTGLDNCNDFTAIHQAFIGELNRTKFAALGGPSESGTHILYQFRQENSLPTNAFPNIGDLVTGPLNNPSTKWVNPDVDRVIFIDDFCGTGQQVGELGRVAIPLLRQAARNIGIELEIWYLTLLATNDGLANVERTTLFQQVGTLSVLDETYRAFGSKSQWFIDPPDYVDKKICEKIMTYYGFRIFRQAPLGYGSCQLLLGFRHNVPDNTLPVIWRENVSPWWRPIFPRSQKLEQQDGGS